MDLGPFIAKGSIWKCDSPIGLFFYQSDGVLRPVQFVPGDTVIIGDDFCFNKNNIQRLFKNFHCVSTVVGFLQSDLSNDITNRCQETKSIAHADCVCRHCSGTGDLSWHHGLGPGWYHSNCLPARRKQRAKEEQREKAHQRKKSDAFLLGTLIVAFLGVGLLVIVALTHNDYSFEDRGIGFFRGVKDKLWEYDRNVREAGPFLKKYFTEDVLRFRRADNNEENQEEEF